MSDTQEKVYSPLELNVGVFFTAKAANERNSVSLNVTRGALKFKFTGFNDIGEKFTIEKRLTTNQIYLFTNMLRALLADRLALVRSHYDQGIGDAKVRYSKIPELDCELHTVYFTKENGFVNNGKLTMSTTEIDGVERITITGYDKDGKSLRVVFLDESGPSVILRASKSTVVDPSDLDFYRFCLEVEQTTKSTLLYAGFDKIYQMLKVALPAQPSQGQVEGGGGNFYKKPFSLFKRKEEGSSPSRTVAVNDSDEDGADLFD